MVKYVLKRIGLAFITAFVIISLTFILIKLLPFEPPIGQESALFTFYEKQVALGYMQKFSRPQSKY